PRTREPYPTSNMALLITQKHFRLVGDAHGIAESGYECLEILHWPATIGCCIDFARLGPLKVAWVEGVDITETRVDVAPTWTRVGQVRDRIEIGIYGIHANALG